LAESIDQALSASVEERMAMSMAARTLVVSRHSQSVMRTQYARIYSECIG
jgi:hypothetical protein